MRSDSLMRSSARSAKTVSPSAQAAATASAGISSMARNARSPAMRVPRRRLARARTRPTGSPMASPVTSTSSSAPIARRASSAPARVGFSPTPSTVTSLPGTISPATIRNVADDRSPGIVSRVGRKRPFQPSGSTTMAPVPSTEMGAPMNPSMRSV